MVGAEHAATREKYLSPAEIARQLSVHPSAPLRWMTRGAVLTAGSRAYLQHIRLPGGFRTTQQWLDEYLRAVADDKVAKATEESAPNSTPKKSERVAQMRARLAASGFQV